MLFTFMIFEVKGFLHRNTATESNECSEIHPAEMISSHIFQSNPHTAHSVNWYLHSTHKYLEYLKKHTILSSLPMELEHWGCN